jgi:hypothetical protein
MYYGFHFNLLRVVIGCCQIRQADIVLLKERILKSVLHEFLVPLASEGISHV